MRCNQPRVGVFVVRGQQGVELLVIFATALAIFIIFYALFAQQYSESAKKRAQVEAVNLADRFAEEINIAARAGDGYERRITYPRTIAGAEEYSLEINNASGSVDVAVVLGPGNIFYYSSPTLTRNITGESMYASPRGFYVEITRGYAFIENRNGEIVVRQLRVS